MVAVPRPWWVLLVFHAGRVFARASDEDEDDYDYDYDRDASPSGDPRPRGSFVF